MLRYSTNLTAEVTGAAATRSVGVAATSLTDSAAVMNAWAASVGGFPIGDPGFQFVNHSGLTTQSRVSPRRMVQFLAAFARRASDPVTAHARLPGGIAGYLKPHNVAAKNFPLDYDRLSVVAKTGTMSYIRGLAGYIATPRGRKLAFAIFSNDLVSRGSGAQKVNKRWMGRAKGFERALIRNWVLKADGRS
jgi:D-alanyl-D-alanine carboxypeptidase/D-alanyl-D-alanine-endopeptidase (penicillin-binding protein 4)